MIVQRELRNAVLAQLLQSMDETVLEKALKPYMKKDPLRLLKDGKPRRFKPFKAIKMMGEGPTASEMVIRDRF